MNSTPERIGNFTSSEIYNLTKLGRDGKSFGAPALSYIAEKNMERRLGRSLSADSKARPLVWGKLVEKFAFEKMNWEYELTSSKTIIHPDFDFWSGSPDGCGPDCVFDIKCPITLKSFCQLVDAGNIEAIRADHSDGEKYYWQLVSNAILTGMNYAELIVYVPYLNDLPAIKLDAADYPETTWIYYGDDMELPFFNMGGYYSDINIIRFEVPQSDKDRLTDCVDRAGKMLIER